MKHKLLIGLILPLIVVFSLCVLFACENNDEQTNNPITTPEETIYRTLEILNGDSHSVKSYAVGTEIKLKAELSADRVFVCWLCQGKPISYEAETIYKVEEDAVISTVYASYGEVVLNTNGGQLPEEYSILVNAYGEKKINAGGALYVGYDFVLPVPTKARHQFKGWYINDKAYTDASGISTEKFDGGNADFTAVYEENPYVNLIIKNKETGLVVKNIKAYIEDGSISIKAEEVADRECIGWIQCEEIFTNEKEFLFNLSEDGIEAGETYTFEALYREAYKLTVISGNGGGFYARTDKVTIKASVPTGNDFIEWVIVFNDKKYALGKATIEGKSVLCFVGETEVVYYLESEQEVRTESIDSIEAVKLGIEDSFTLSDMEKIGVVITGGNETLIKAEFKRKDYSVTYIADCNIEGQYCLDENGEKALIKEGFVFIGNGLYSKEEYYNYNEQVTLSTVPQIEHYKFGGWQNAEAGEKIPTTMPNKDFTIKGTFLPEKYLIKVISPSNTEGNVRIGLTGNTTSGYYNYGSTIQIYVIAEAGYKFGQWLDMEEADAGERVIQNGDEVRTDTISYSYSYKVQQNEQFTIRFVERDYIINYIFEIWYDGRNITEDESFFEPGQYEEGYWQTQETRNYGVSGGLKEKFKIKSESAPDGLPLIYGPENWTVGEWTMEKAGVGDPTNFIMPKYDISVKSICTINSYNIGFSKQDGIKNFIVNTVNDKSPELYETENGYKLPYASELDIMIDISDGYRIQGVKASGIILDSDSGYKATELKEYNYSVVFKMLENDDRGTIYALWGEKNVHTIKYYIAVDYLHTNIANCLSEYITYNEGDIKKVGEKTYFLVDKVKNENGEMAEINENDCYYGDAIKEPTIDASWNRYDFKGWTKMQGNDEYTKVTMPDDSIWMYGNFTLKKYEVSLETRKFKFDGNPNVNIKTANVNKIIEGGEETIYNEQNEYETKSILYFSEIKLSRHNPTGYDFTQWEITTSENGKQDVTVIIDTTSAVVGEINVVVDDTTKKEYKYCLNDDDTITLYLTENSKIKAIFDIKTFTATTLDSGIMVKPSTVSNASAFESTCIFEYGTTLDVFYNCETLTRSGKKLDSMTFDEKIGNQITGELESVSADFNADNLKYSNGSNTVVKTTNMGFTSDVVIDANISNIDYKLIYRLYSAVDGLKYISEQPIEITEDENGIPFTVQYNQTIETADDEETKVLASINGMRIENTMYSGWYEGEELGSVEGKGMTDSNNNYVSKKEYTHQNALQHAVLSCYLLNLFTYSSEGIELNPNIKDTGEYRRHFNENYKVINLPPENEAGISIKVINNQGFYQMTALERVIIPDSITKIGESAFEGCGMLTETGMTDNISEIGNRAYFGCNLIEEVTIGTKVVNIGTKAFAEMSKLSQINYNTKATTTGLTPLTVGSGVFYSSGSQAKDEGMTLTIGDQVTLFGKELFYSKTDEEYGKNLKIVNFLEGSEAKDISIGGNAFAYTGINTFNTSDRIIDFGESAFGYCDELTSIDLTKTSITEIGTKVFEACGISEVILPEAVKTIKDFAFLSCNSLVSVYYSNEEGLSIIGEGAFHIGDSGNKQVLTRIVSIDKRAEVIADATLYKEIILSNVNQIGDNAFFGCEAIENIVIGGENTVIGKTILYGANNLKKVKYNVVNGANKLNEGEASFTGIGVGGCELIIGESVNSVPNYMFYGFSAVETFTVPTTINALGKKAFGNMMGLKTINFNINGNDFEIIENGQPFFGAGAESGLKVVFGENVELIKGGIFDETTNLNDLTIVEDEEKDLLIGNNAFRNTKLSAIYLPNRKSIDIGKNVFYGVPLENVTIESGNNSVIIRQGAFSTSSFISSVEINAFGTETEGLTALLQSGTLNVIKETNGYIATVNGQLDIIPNDNDYDFVLKEEDCLIISPGSELLIKENAGAIIHGTITNNGTLNRHESIKYFKAITYNKQDFIEKNTISAYTFIQMASGTDYIFSEAIMVNAKEFEINVNANFNKGIVVNSDKITVQNEKVVLISTQFQAQEKLSGEIKINPHTEVTIAGSMVFNNGEALEGNFCLTDGTASIKEETLQGKEVFTYTINGDLTINNAYTQTEEESVVMIENSLFSVQTEAIFINLKADTGSTIKVAEDGILILNNNAEASNFHAIIESEVLCEKMEEKVENYYGKLTTALESETEENPLLVLQKDIELIEMLIIPTTLRLDFNGNALSATKCGVQISGTVEFINSSYTSTEFGVAISGNGNFNLKSGNISADEKAISITGEVTIGSDAQVNSTNGTAVECANAKIDGELNGVNGLIINGNNKNDLTEINGVIKANEEQGIAISVDGQTPRIIINGELSGYIGAKLENSDLSPDTNNPILKVEENGLIRGQIAGVHMTGGGYTLIKGRVESVVERTIKATGESKLYSGAVVGIEPMGADLYIEITGTVSNTNGDAVLYVGYDNTDNNSTAVSVESTGTIDGTLAELNRWYEETNYSDGYEGEAYALNEGKMSLYSGYAEIPITAEHYSYYSQKTIKINIANRDYCGDEANGSDILNDETIRYMTMYETLSEAQGKNSLIRINCESSEIDCDLLTGETLILNGIGQIIGEGTRAINGIIALHQEAILDIQSNMTLNGKIIAFGIKNESEEIIEDEIIVNGKTLTVNGEIKANKSIQVEDGGKFIVSGKIKLMDNSILKNNGETEFLSSSEVTINGSLISNSDSVLKFNKNITIDGKLKVYGATISNENTVNIVVEEVFFGKGQNANSTVYSFPHTIETRIYGMDANDVTVEMNGTLIIKEENAMGIITEQGNSTLVLNGNGNILRGASEIKINLDLEGNTTMCLGGITTENTWKIGAKVNLKDEKNTGSGQLTTSGTVVMELGGELVANTLCLDVKDDITPIKHGGIENYGGILELEEPIKMESGSWMFTENDKTPYGYTSILAITYTENLERGTVISICQEHVYEEVPATCGEIGFIGCKYEIRNGVLSDGTKFVVRHDRKEIKPATGEHTFTKNDESTHICSECGTVEAHDLRYVSATTREGIITLNGNIIYVLGKRCTDCDYCDKMIILENSTTVAEFNNLKLKYLYKIGTMQDIYDVKINKLQQTTLASYSEGIVTVDGIKYEAIKVCVDEPEPKHLGDYYVLVKHICTEFYIENGKHICKDCQTEKTTAEAHSDMILLTEIGGNTVASYDCTACGNAPIIISATTETEFRTKIGNIIGLCLIDETAVVEEDINDLFSEVVYYNGKYYNLHGNVAITDGYSATANTTSGISGTMYVLVEHRCTNYAHTGLNYCCTSCGEFDEADTEHMKSDDYRGEELMDIGGTEYNILVYGCTKEDCLGGGIVPMMVATVNEAILNANAIGISLNNISYTASSALSGKIGEIGLSTTTFEGEAVYVLPIALTDGNGDEKEGNYGIIVYHQCVSFSASGTGHICIECGAEHTTSHTTDANNIVYEYKQVGSKRYQFAYKETCCFCKEKELIIFSGETIEELSVEANALTATFEHKQSDGTIITTTIHGALAETIGELYRLYPNTVKLTTTGNIVEVTDEAEGTVYQLLYITFGTEATYAVLFTHSCREYLVDEAGTGHVCKDCGKATNTEHAEDYMTGKQITTDQNSQYIILWNQCQICGEGTKYSLSSNSMFEVKTTIASLSAYWGGVEYSVSLTNEVTALTTPSSSSKTYTEDEIVYYLWEITLTPISGENALNAYVLVNETT